MAKSILNDSIQGQLSDIKEKIDELLNKNQNIDVPPQNESSIEHEPQPALTKEDIAEIVHKRNIALFSAILRRLNRIEYKKMDIISRKLNKIRKRPHVKIKGSRFYLSTLVITILSIIGVISICVNFKQCSNYDKINNKYYNQLITIDNLKTENDSLKVKVLLPSTTEIKKKRK